MDPPDILGVDLTAARPTQLPGRAKSKRLSPLAPPASSPLGCAKSLLSVPGAAPFHPGAGQGLSPSALSLLPLACCSPGWQGAGLRARASGVGGSAQPRQAGLCPAGLRPGPSSPPGAGLPAAGEISSAQSEPRHPQPGREVGHSTSATNPQNLQSGGTPTSICSRPAAAGGGARSMHRAPAADRPGCRLLPALPLRLPCSRALSSPAGQPPPRPPQPSILLTSKSGCSGSPTRAPPLFSLSSFLPRYSGRAVRFSPGAAPGPLRRARAPPGTRG